MNTEQIPFAIPDTPTWICVGKLFDGTHSLSAQPTHLIFDTKQILYVDQTPPPPQLRPQNQTQPHATLSNTTVLPGLIEGHSHLFLEGAELDFEKRKTYQAQLPKDLLEHAQKRLQNILHTGVVAMRDGGDKDGVGLSLKSNSQPLLTSPGAAIYHKGRYGSFIGSPVENHASPQDCVAARVAQGADHIKVVPTGIINFQKGQVTKAPQMTTSEISTLVTAAKNHSKHVMAHASGTEGIESAIQGGVNTIEHGFFITTEQLTYMRDHDIAWVPTFVPVQIQVDEAEKMGWNNKIVDNLQKILDDHAKRLQEADQMGVTIIAGSDAGSCGVAHGWGLLYEMELMERAGLSATKTLHTATGAHPFAFKEKIGQIKTGYASKLIFTQHDPTETVTHLQKPKWVLANGKWYPSDPQMNLQGL